MLGKKESKVYPWVDCLANWIMQVSATTKAAIASTIGMARLTIQGSWRPRASNSDGVPV